MSELTNFALLSFVSLFTMINPLGVVPIFISMTATLDNDQTRRTARKAILTAFILLVVFGLTGRIIFEFFSISIDSLRIVGGVLFFFMGYDMLQARLSRIKHDDEPDTEYVSDIAITPLAIPMICGPGAITAVIVLNGDAVDITQRTAVFVNVTIIMLITYFALIGGERIMRTLGDSGNKVLIRLMGLIVMAIAVEFFFGGLKPILRDILMIAEPAG